MKYYLFAWEHYDAKGGLGDLLGVYSSLETAENEFLTRIRDHAKRIDSAQILDLETQKIIRTWGTAPKRIISNSAPDYQLEERLPEPHGYYLEHWYRSDVIID